MTSKIRSIMVCEDVRRDSNGKEILIGIYGSGINFYGPAPGRLRIIYFRVELAPAEEGGTAIVGFQFLNPSGAVMLDLKSDIEIAPPSKSVMVFANENLTLYEAGQYKLRATCGDDVLEDQFHVLFNQPAPPGAVII